MMTHDIPRPRGDRDDELVPGKHVRCRECGYVVSVTGEGVMRWHPLGGKRGHLPCAFGGLEPMRSVCEPVSASRGGAP